MTGPQWDPGPYQHHARTRTGPRWGHAASTVADSEVKSSIKCKVLFGLGRVPRSTQRRGVGGDKNTEPLVVGAGPDGVGALLCGLLRYTAGPLMEPAPARSCQQAADAGPPSAGGPPWSRGVMPPFTGERSAGVTHSRDCQWCAPSLVVVPTRDVNR